jgi:hypothetical protein
MNFEGVGMVSPIRSITRYVGHRDLLARSADQQPVCLAKLAAPNAPCRTLWHALLDQAVCSAFTQFNGPASYLLSETLAATLADVVIAASLYAGGDCAIAPYAARRSGRANHAQDLRAVLIDFGVRARIADRPSPTIIRIPRASSRR